MAQVREIVDRPDLDLVGVLVYSPAKAGLDAGEPINRSATGVQTTDNGCLLARYCNRKPNAAMPPLSLIAIEPRSRHCMRRCTHVRRQWRRSGGKCLGLLMSVAARLRAEARDQPKEGAD